MSADTILPLDNHIEEPEEAALRHELGVRQIFFRCGDLEDPNLEPAAVCPSWCHYVETGSGHEVDPERPYVAYHPLGFAPTVAASLYPGQFHRGNRRDSTDPSYIEAARIDVRAGQLGLLEPEVEVCLRAPTSATKPEALRLTVSDAKDLIKALGYVVDVLEGTRDPLDRKS